jgi:hypothetical protein
MEVLIVLALSVVGVLLVRSDWRRLSADAERKATGRRRRDGLAPSGRMSAAGLWCVSASLAALAVALVAHPEPPSFSARGTWLLEFLHAALTVAMGVYGPAIAVAALAFLFALWARKRTKSRPNSEA